MASLNSTLKKATMQDMKVKRDNSPKEVTIDAPSNDIPYGLRISLNHDSLKNLGLSVKDFDLEGQVCIKAQCEITEIRSSKSTDWNSENVELQIVSMSIAEKE